ncbi:MAG: cation:dicarboxylase symporter family transporter [Ignavibacteria bacterium]|nr:cation:dicarboxylase symporter family transporter [Ignavibacteria bacterium]MBL7991715.1 cation:dicarboxylase symporter family transporter [Candidatus Kapabacteria bacterium]
MWSFIRRISLVQWIFVALIAGIAFGANFPEAASNLKILSTIFLRMIKSIVAPMIFGTLVVGIAGHGDDVRRIGRLAWRSFLYFELATTIALFVGLGAAHLVQPGVGIALTGSVNEAKEFASKSSQVTFSGVLEHMIPQSFFEAAAHNEVLQVVFFAVIFAIALTQVKPGPAKETVLNFCEGLSQTMFKFTGIIMNYAPIGIGAAIGYVVGQSGLGVLWNLGKLVLTLYGALAVFILGVLIPIALVARIPLLRFIRAIKEPAVIAFTTSSSEAALPLAMQNMEKFGVPQRIVSFVLPTGYSFNLDGSTLYLAVASIFVAQAAGVELSFGTQMTMMLSLMITSKGVAAVARASLVILSGTLVQFGLPLEGIAIILGVDAFMDMARTTVNLIGNCLASAVMARWEGVLDIPAEEPVSA